MKKGVYWFILLFTLFFNLTVAIAATEKGKPEIEREAISEEATEENPKTDITGYGEYILGTDLSEFDLSDFEGPVRDISFEDIEAYNYVQLNRIFYHSAGSMNINLFLSFTDDKLVVIHLDFSNLFLDFDDLDDVSRYVRALRQNFLDNYDRDLVVENTFFFDFQHGTGRIGMLELEDEEGDKLLMIWNRYDLNIYYMAASAYEETLEVLESAIKEEENRL